MGAIKLGYTRWDDVVKTLITWAQLYSGSYLYLPPIPSNMCGVWSFKTIPNSVVAGTQWGFLGCTQNGLRILPTEDSDGVLFQFSSESGFPSVPSTSGTLSALRSEGCDCDITSVCSFSYFFSTSCSLKFAIVAHLLFHHRRRTTKCLAPQEHSSRSTTIRSIHSWWSLSIRQSQAHCSMWAASLTGNLNSWGLIRANQLTLEARIIMLQVKSKG